MLAYAGLRPGEALALRLGDVGARTILVERAVALGDVKGTKTEKPASVILKEVTAPYAAVAPKAIGGRLVAFVGRPYPAGGN